MAQNSVNVGVNLTLNPQSLSAATKEIKQSLGRISGSASEFQKSLDASTARVFAFGATTLVINGVNQAFKALVTTTIDVEKRLIEINSIFGGTASEFAKFREDIFKVAKDTGQSFNTVADAAAEFARQGLSAEETAKRLEAALILTRVSGLDSVKAVSALTAAINGFASAGLTAAQITNKLIAVDTAFAVSAQDLAEGFSRAGSTAEDAGVSFDELLGIITAVQQTTSRGGAVIGNALKSIFTRLSRSSTIEDLQGLGVAIDASQSGVQKLKALSDALSQISDPTKSSQIKELAGGVYQINIVSAALKDLSKESSIFTQATATSASATNEALQKNDALNKSLAAQLNSLVIGFTNLAEKIGQLTFAPLLSTLAGLASKVSDFFNEALDPEKGNKFVQGLLKSIGSFLSGPALVLITTAFFKIITLVAKYAKEGFSSILSIGAQTEKLKSVQDGIVNSLINDKKFREQILNTTLTQAQKQQAVADAIERENKLLRDQQQILQALANIAIKTGVSGFNTQTGFTGKGAPRKASGYIPNFSASTQEAIMETSAARQHGYKAGKVYNTKLYDGQGGSFDATVNSAEKIKTVRGQNGKLGTYVIPPNGFAAKGFIPNFASLSSQSNSVLEKYAQGIGRNISAAKQAEARKILDSRLNKQPIDIASYIGTPLPTILTPNTIGDGSRTDKSLFGGQGGLFNFKTFKIQGGGKQAALQGEVEKEFSDQSIKDFAEGRTLRLANSISSALGGNPTEPSKITQIDAVKGFVGAVRAAFGSLFDGAVSTALNLTSKQPDGGGDFDVRLSNKNAKQREQLGELFGGSAIPPTGLADFKIGNSKDSLKNMADKTIKEYGLSKAKVPTIKASGFIPNFAAINDAIQREKNAGVPKSSIYLDSSPLLKSSVNPNGLMIANTIDEPNGGFQGINRAKKEGINPKKYGAAGGFIPNFATPQAKIGNLGNTGLASKEDSYVTDALLALAKAIKAKKITVEAATKSFELVTKATGASVTQQKTLNDRGRSLIEAYGKEIDARQKAAIKLKADRSGGSGGSGDTGGSSSKFGSALDKAQISLFALSTISNTLLSSNSKLNDTIQTTVLVLSTLSAITSLAGGLEGFGGALAGGLKTLGPLAVAFKSLSVTVLGIGGVLVAAAAAVGLFYYNQNKANKAIEEGLQVNEEIKKRRDKKAEESVSALKFTGASEREVSDVLDRATDESFRVQQIGKFQARLEEVGGGIIDSFRESLGFDVTDSTLAKRKEIQDKIDELERQGTETWGAYSTDVENIINAQAQLKDANEKATKLAFENTSAGRFAASTLNSRNNLFSQGSSLEEKKTDIKKQLEDSKKSDKSNETKEQETERIKAEEKLNAQLRNVEADIELNKAALDNSLKDLRAVVDDSATSYESAFNDSLDKIRFGTTALQEALKKASENLFQRGQTIDIASGLTPKTGEFSGLLESQLKIAGGKAKAESSRNDFQQSVASIADAFAANKTAILKISDAPERNRQSLIKQFQLENKRDGTGDKSTIDGLDIQQTQKVNSQFINDTKKAEDQALKEATKNIQSISADLKSGKLDENIFNDFYKTGEKGLKDALSKTFSSVNFDSEEGTKLFDSIKENAIAYRDNLIQGYTEAKNIQTEINNEITKNGLELVAAQRKALSDLPNTLKTIQDTSPIDPTALFKKFEEAAKLLKTGKVEDTAKANKILSSTAGESDKFKTLFGEKNFQDFQTRSGLTTDLTAKSVQASTLGKIDFSTIEKIIREKFGNGLSGGMAALNDLRKDPTKSSEFIQKIQSLSSGGSQSLQSAGNTIIGSLGGLGSGGSTVKQLNQGLRNTVAGSDPFGGPLETKEVNAALKNVAPALQKFIDASKDPKSAESPKLLNESFESLKTELTKVLGKEKGTKFAEAYKDTVQPKGFTGETEEIKGLTEKQQKLFLQIDAINKQVEDFGKAFETTGIKKSIDSLTTIIDAAAANITSYSELTKKLDSISRDVSQRLGVLENKITNVQS